MPTAARSLPNIWPRFWTDRASCAAEGFPPPPAAALVFQEGWYGSESAFQAIRRFFGNECRHPAGAPVEPGIWTVERIERTYGDIRGYIKEYKHFAADDDANGPFFFCAPWTTPAVRSLPPGSVSEAYLNYTREGIGMFWWGGLGVSTEHTAYLNLLSGIPAPQSGSIRQNGRTVAEQIGRADLH